MFETTYGLVWFLIMDKIWNESYLAWHKSVFYIEKSKLDIYQSLQMLSCKCLGM